MSYSAPSGLKAFRLRTPEKTQMLIKPCDNYDKVVFNVIYVQGFHLSKEESKKEKIT